MGNRYNVFDAWGRYIETAVAADPGCLLGCLFWIGLLSPIILPLVIIMLGLYILTEGWNQVDETLRTIWIACIVFCILVIATILCCGASYVGIFAGYDVLLDLTAPMRN